MSSAQEHPSFLALDRAALHHASPEVQAHLATCAQCEGYVQQQGGLTVVPAWVKEAHLRRPRWRFPGWMSPVALAAALATAGLLIVVRTPDTPSVAATRAKGAPTLALFVKRGDDTFQWDGSAPVAPGDRLRLRITPEGYSHVTVLSGPAQANPSLLYAGELPQTGQSLLPGGWTVDENGEEERLVIILSDHAVPEMTRREVFRAPRRDAELWTLSLVLRKAEGPGERPR